MRTKEKFASSLLVLFFLALCLPSLGEDAWMFRANPAHSGVYEATGVPTLGGVKWRVHTGGMVIGSPAVAQGKVYFGSTNGNLYVGSADGNLYALR